MYDVDDKLVADQAELLPSVGSLTHDLGGLFERHEDLVNDARDLSEQINAIHDLLVASHVLLASLFLSVDGEDGVHELLVVHQLLQSLA